MIVLDSSAAVEFLVGRDLGVWVETQLAADPDLHAPHLIDVEVASALRKLVRLGEIGESFARRALTDFADFDLARYPHLPFLGRIWQLRTNLTAPDATYVALTESLGATLVTTDRRFARAPALRTRVIAP